ncbi:MAG: PAS domain S-box protein [Acidobacteriota bacterium]
MDRAMRDSGIRILGRVPWGTHFCQFYKTRKDLLDVLVPYFQAGLASNEYCMWICSEPLGIADARKALRRAVPGLDRKIRAGKIEILSHDEWYLRNGRFSSRRVLRGWVEKLNAALDRGFAGLRLSGSAFWLEKGQWDAFTAYEEAINAMISKYPMLALCTYSLERCDAREIIDVLDNHEQALVRRGGKWILVASSVARKARIDLKASQDRFREVFDKSPIGIELFDAGGRLREANRACLEMFGVADPDEVRGFRLFEDPNLTPDIAGKIRKGFPVRREFRYDFTKISRAGLFRTRRSGPASLDVQITPLRSAGRTVEGYLVQIMDISERKAAETALRASYEMMEKRISERTSELVRTVRQLRREIAERHEREQDLRQQSALLNLARDAIIVRDPDYRITFWNDGAQKIYGWTDREATGRVAHVLLGTQFPERLKAVQDSLMKAGHWEGEMVRTRKDGQRIVVESRWAVLPGKSKRRPEAILEISRDVTQRRHVEGALRSASAYTRGLIEASLDPLVTINSEGKITDVNRATEAATGLPRALLIGTDFSTCFTEPERARAGYRQVFDKGEVRDYPLAIRHVSGAVTKVLYNAAVYRDADGKVDGVFAAARDVTALRNAEQARQRLATAVEQLADGIAITDLDGRVLSTNPAFGDHHALRPGEIVGRSLQEILRIDGRGLETAGTMDRTIRAGKVWNWHVARRVPGKQVREYELSVSPIRDDEGRLIHCIAVSRDVTQEIQLQERIRQWQKMEALGTLAGGIAHDFNNILLPILINTELTLSEEPPDAPATRRLGQVLEAAKRGKDMVRQIIAFSQQKEQDRRPVEIAPIVREALKLLRISMPKTIEIAERIEAGSAVIVADPTQIQQVLMNLGNNAAYAMRETGGVLDVSVSEVSLDKGMAERFLDIKPGSYVRLSVRDTGQGIPPEVMDRIFEPFFTTKKKGEGTGMGLAVVHGVVKGHGGAISVSSEVGKGTTFTVYLPRVAGEAARTEESPEPFAKGTERILFVDDEDIQVRAMTKLLEHLGYRVVGLTDAVEALELVRKDPGAFDLVIMDQTMPRLSGGEMAGEILRLRPGLPLILCTGYSETLDEEQALAMGIRAFVMKPFSVKEIALSIRRALAPAA